MAFESQHDSVVLYHKNCLDGLGAAWAAWTGLNREVDLIPVQYGMKFEELFGEGFCDLIGKNVYCLDFSFDRKSVNTLRNICNFTLLDHHVTAAKALEGLYEKEFSEIEHYTRNPSIGLMPEVILVDQKYSGAMLSWMWFHPDRVLSPPFGIQAVQDRDLWQWKVHGSKEWTAAGFSYDMTVENFDKLIARNLESVIDEGAALLRSQDKNVKVLSKGARRFKLDEFDVPVVNANACFASDLGAVLAEGEPFSLTYHDCADGRQFSLRTGRKDILVNEIAERFGGGGHPGAAGFRIFFDDDQFHRTHMEVYSEEYAKNNDVWVKYPVHEKPAEPAYTIKLDSLPRAIGVKELYDKIMQKLNWHTSDESQRFYLNDKFCITVKDELGDIQMVFWDNRGHRESLFTVISNGSGALFTPSTETNVDTIIKAMEEFLAFVTLPDKD